MDEAAVLARASSACAQLERVRLLLAPLCASLRRVHMRTYLHPMHAPRLLLLLAATLEACGAALRSAAHAEARTEAVRAVARCEEGLVGLVRPHPHPHPHPYPYPYPYPYP